MRGCRCYHGRPAGGTGRPRLEPGGALVRAERLHARRERVAKAGLGVASLLKTEGESSAELDGSSLPLLVVEGKILVL